MAKQWHVAAECAACLESFCEADRVVSCPSCSCSLHLRCAVQAFSRPDSQLLPQGSGTCPSCQQALEWPILIRSARRFPRSLARAESSAPSLARGLKSAARSGSAMPASVIEEVSTHSAGDAVAVHPRKRRRAEVTDGKDVSSVKAKAARRRTIPAGESLRERLFRKGLVDA